MTRATCAELCGCVYCSCQRMVQSAVGFRCSQQYARFGSDVITASGYHLPPGDLSPGIIIDDLMFEDLHVSASDDAVAGLALMLCLGRFGSCCLDVPDALA